MPVRRSTRFRFSSFNLSFVALAMIVMFARPAFADTVRGRVVDPQDRPIVRANVLILRGQTVVANATTDADGRFAAVTLPPGRYDVSVVAPGLRAQIQTIDVTPDSAADLTFKLALAARSESVFVSATHVDSAMSRTSDSVTAITRDDLESHQINTASDSLRFVPGLTVVQSGSRGALTSIFPRGGESDYTLILVDGIPQNSFGGGFDAAHLGTADIDRIEIVRGPQSALYGSGAIGGLVQIITKQGGPLRADAHIEGGGYGTWETGASAAGSSGAWRWGGAIDGLSTDGDTRFRDNLGTRVTNDDYDRVNVSGGVGWSDRPDRSLRFDVRGGRNEGGFPGPYGSDPLHRYGGLDTFARGTNTLGEFGAAALFGSASTIRHHANVTFANLKNEFVDESFANPGTTGDPSIDRTRRATLRYQFDLNRRALGLSGGVEYTHERAENSFVTGPNFDDKLPINRNDTGFFVEARPMLGERAFVTAGLRVERISRDALAADGSSFGRPTDLPADVVWSVNPKVSAAWYLRPASAAPAGGLGAGWTKIRGGAGTGIKPPTTFDIGFTNNPNLKPERSKSYDLGIEQALAGSALVLDLTWFYNRYEDLIVAVPTAISGPAKYRTDNIANARSRGLEFGASARFPVGVAVRGSWTWLDTEVLGVDGLPTFAPSPYNVGDRLFRRPPQQGSLDVAWTAGRTTIFGTVNGRGTMTDIEPNFGSPTFDNPGYAVASIGASFKVTPIVVVTARVNNLFDRAYEEAFGFPALGRSAMIGVRVTTGR